MSTRIGNITLSDVRLGKVWRVDPPLLDWNVNPIEEADLVEFDGKVPLAASDQVVYAGLVAFPSGRLKAVLLFKPVGEVSSGGVYWEFLGGKWRMVGEEPDPNYEIGGKEFIANPLVNDPSFDAPDHDLRTANRTGFLKHAQSLRD